MSEVIEVRRGIGNRAAPSVNDWSTVRRDFPILQKRVNGRPLVWLDNAATTQKPRTVIDRLVRFYEHENANIHRSGHTLGSTATAAYEHARDVVRRFLNAASSDSIVFVRGTTEATNLVAHSWGRQQVGEGDEVLISWLEHSSNIVPWQQLAFENRAELKVAPIDDRGQIILSEFERLLSPRTRIVALTHVSNAIGTVLPLQQMINLAHRHGARVFVDGAQAAAHVPVDVQALDADFYAFSGHKVFGPTGIGALYARAGLLDAVEPWQSGGHMVSGVTFGNTTYRTGPARFEAGTGNIAGAVGLAAALEYVLALGRDRVYRHEQELTRLATEALRRVNGLHLIGDATERVGVLSFVIDGLAPDAVGAALDRDGIAVRAGHHCAQPALSRFGHLSSIRASLALYNTPDEVGALSASLQRLVKTGGWHS